MLVFVRRTLAASFLLVVAGCVTDDFAVYKDSVVNKEAAKAFVGVYEVKDWPGNEKPESISVTEKDGQLRFAYSVPGKKYDVRFVLSKIPNSNKGLYLLSIPAQEATNQANMFFLGRAEKENTHIWAVISTLAVAKDHLSFLNGKTKAEEVKRFLAMRGDEFVTANDPQVRLKNPKH